MKTALLTLLVALGVGAAGGIAAIGSGLRDGAAAHADSVPIAWAIHKAEGARPGGIAAPAGLYAAKYLGRHGGAARTGTALGPNPSPPDLFRRIRPANPAQADRLNFSGATMTAVASAQAPGLSTAAFSAATGLARPVAAISDWPAGG